MKTFYALIYVMDNALSDKNQYFNLFVNEQMEEIQVRRAS